MPPERDDDRYGDSIKNAKRTKKIIEECYRIGIGAVAFPLQATKALVQLGYEPFPLQKGVSYGFFGAEVRYLPNFFSYTKRTYDIYGFSAIYRGVGASICGGLVGAITTVLVDERLAKYYHMDDNDDTNRGALDRAPNSGKVVRSVIRRSLATVAGLTVARPFQVVTFRLIAQQVGGEEYYGGVFSSLCKIYKDEGLYGLFAGLIPQIAYELCVYWTISSAIYAVEYLWRSYVEKEERGEDLDEEPLDAKPPEQLTTVVRLVVPLFVNSIFYPLQLVSTVMAINGAPLVAGLPPFIPVYPTWQDCFHDLAAKNQLKRGGKTFFRFYEKPITYRHGEVYALPNA